MSVNLSYAYINAAANGCQEILCYVMLCNVMLCYSSGYDMIFKTQFLKSVPPNPSPPASQGKILGAHLARVAAAPGGRFQGAATVKNMNTLYGNIPFAFRFFHLLRQTTEESKLNYCSKFTISVLGDHCDPQPPNARKT